jgi:hypothetical protein
MIHHPRLRESRPSRIGAGALRRKRWVKKRAAAFTDPLRGVSGARRTMKRRSIDERRVGGAMRTAGRDERENSTLINLRELMRIEDDRVEAEQAAERAAVEAEQKALLEARRREAEARAAAERERADAEARREADERLATLKARLEHESAERLARVQLELAQRAIVTQPITSPPAPSRRARLGAGWVIGVISAFVTVSALGYVGLVAPRLADAESRAATATRLADARKDAMSALERELAATRAAAATAAASVVTSESKPDPHRPDRSPKPRTDRTVRKPTTTDPLLLDANRHDPLAGIGEPSLIPSK